MIFNDCSVTLSYKLDDKQRKEIDYAIGRLLLVAMDATTLPGHTKKEAIAIRRQELFEVIESGLERAEVQRFNVPLEGIMKPE